MPVHVEHVGRISLSPSRRLAVTLRTETGEPSPFLDLRLQLLADGRWHPTAQGIAIEGDALPELLGVLETAIGRLSICSG